MVAKIITYFLILCANNYKLMKTKIAGSVFIILMAITSSCYTYVLFEKPTPPEIIPEKQVNKIAFINAYDYTIPDTASRSENNIYQAGVSGVINGLKKSFASDDNIQFIITDTLKKGKSPAALPDSLNPDSVRNVCRITNSDMLLVLEAFNMNMDWEQEVEEDEDGSRSRTNNYYLNMSAGLSLYSESGDVIDRSMDQCRSLHESRAALIGIAVFVPSIYKAEKQVEPLAEFVAENYVNKFYPGTTSVSRKIYYAKNMMEADKYLMGHDWSSAIELLKPFAESPDPKIARKAANNFSIAYEAMGNDRAAEFWLNKSKEGIK
jgi:hypothetical protein